MLPVHMYVSTHACTYNSISMRTHVDSFYQFMHYALILLYITFCCIGKSSLTSCSNLSQLNIDLLSSRGIIISKKNS